MIRSVKIVLYFPSNIDFSFPILVSEIQLKTLKNILCYASVKFLNQEIAFTLFERYKKYLHILTEPLKSSQVNNQKNNKRCSLANWSC